MENESSVLVGESLPIQRLRILIGKLGPTTLPVLIQGPTGSGKELVAKAIHKISGRPGPLVAFNVCAIPENLLEAALFGHVRGGFTGAHGDLPGYLAEADQGTAFFDEIGGLPSALQPKLLRALETRGFRPVGGRTDRRSNFRILSATNDDLGVLVDRGRFRADLAYRLQAAVLIVPPLDERREDIPLLVDCFLRGIMSNGAGQSRTISPSALDLLLDYDWPGNVRELRHVVEVAVALSETSVLGARDVKDALTRGRTREVSPERTAGRHRLLEVLKRVGWDTMAAADELGVHRATVYRWMRRVGIQSPGSHRPAFASIRANSHRLAANPTPSA